MMRLMVVTAYLAARSAAGRHKSFTKRGALLAGIGLPKRGTLHLIDEELAMPALWTISKPASPICDSRCLIGAIRTTNLLERQ
jgi:hypothetical protein